MHSEDTDTRVTGVRHACAVATSDEHRYELSARYIAEGLAEGEHVVYFEDGTVDGVLARLAEDGVCADAAIVAGRLTIASAEATRALFSGPVADLEEALDEAVSDVLARGFTGIRVTGEAGHAVHRLGGIGPVDYEQAFRRALQRHPQLRVLCLYDQQLPPTLLTTLTGMHEHEVSAPSVYDDGLLRIVRTGVGEVRLAGEADHSNRGILDRLLATVLDETLRSPTAAPCVTADVASLRFLDVAGAMSFVHAAEQFPTTHRLALRGVRPRVHRVLERCGALFTPQLELEARADPRAPGQVRAAQPSEQSSGPRPDLLDPPSTELQALSAISAHPVDASARRS